MDTASFDAFPAAEHLVEKLPSAALTPREIEVLRLLADGASNKIIAHRLGISDHTVKFHVTSILSKNECRYAHRSRNPRSPHGTWSICKVSGRFDTGTSPAIRSRSL